MYIRNLIVTNEYTGRTYVEPFAGGFGVGIALSPVALNVHSPLEEFRFQRNLKAVIQDADQIIRDFAG